MGGCIYWTRNPGVRQLAIGSQVGGKILGGAAGTTALEPAIYYVVLDERD